MEQPMRLNMTQEELEEIQPGITELAEVIFYGNTATCKVKADNDFYRSSFNRVRYLEGSSMIYFG